MKEPLIVQHEHDYGASFLTGGLIAVGLLVSTVVGTSIISHEWAPAPQISKEYVESQRDYVMVPREMYNRDVKELGQCREDNTDWAKKWDKDHGSGGNCNVMLRDGGCGCTADTAP